MSLQNIKSNYCFIYSVLMVSDYAAEDVINYYRTNLEGVSFYPASHWNAETLDGASFLVAWKV